jgi:hypothetical protein
MDYFIVDRPDANGSLPDLVECKRSDRHPNSFYTQQEMRYKMQDGDVFYLDGRYENGVYTPPQPFNF